MNGQLQQLELLDRSQNAARFLKCIVWGGYGNSVRGERRSPEALQLEPDFRDFDLKTIVPAKHAQHVVLIHFTVALFTIGVLFDFLAQ